MPIAVFVSILVTMAYPETKKVDVVDDYFGTKVADPYRWLEDDNAADTKAWVKAQNAVTFAFLAGIPAREGIRRRLTALWNFEKFGVPFERGGRWFRTHNSGLQNQAVLYVSDDAAKRGRVLLDPNTLATDGTAALTGTAVTDDGKLLAYSISRAGSDWQTWKVRDVATGADLADEVSWSKASGASWRKDGSGFYYSRFPAPREGDSLKGVNQGHQVWFHRLGAAQKDDVLVYERPDQREWYLWADVTDDGRWLVITASKGTNPETSVFVQDLARPGAPVEPLLDHMDARYRVIDSDGDVFFVLTNQGAPRQRLVAVRRGASEPRAWRELVPQAKGRDVLEDVALVADRLVVNWMRDAHNVLEVFTIDGKRASEVKLPALGTVTTVSGRRRDREAFVGFTSFTYPGTVLRLDPRTGATKVLDEPKVAFEPGAYEVRQVFYPSKDGTLVPMFIVHRRGLAMNGQNPTLLYGYGGFDVSLTPTFSVSRLGWLELGGVLAVANLRGGGEYGLEWYDAGRLGKKQNVFDDFIAAAEWLIRERVTSTPRLAINGGSNGGLLVGAVMTQRPELFGAAVPEVGVMDMLRFHRFTLGWGWKSDFGSSETKEGFDTLIEYSPLHNLKKGVRYPPTLVTTGDHDDRVVPAHSHKFIAMLQAMQGGEAPVLTRIEVDAGHGAGKPTEKIIAERADVLAFLVKVLGMEVPVAAK